MLGFSFVQSKENQLSVASSTKLAMIKEPGLNANPFYTKNEQVEKYVDELFRYIMMDHSGNKERLLGEFFYRFYRDNQCTEDFGAHDRVNGLHRYEWAYCCVTFFVLLQDAALFCSPSFQEYVVAEARKRFFRSKEVLSMFNGLIPDSAVIELYQKPLDSFVTWGF